MNAKIAEINNMIENEEGLKTKLLMRLSQNDA